jgi:O-antigen/teichoic acid export membrane protein
LKSILGKYSLSEYKRGFLMIFSSKIVIALISFLTTPLLARFFHPGDYGLFALINSVVVTISLLSNLSLPLSLLVVEESRLSNAVFSIVAYSFFANLLFLALGLIVVLAMPELTLANNVNVNAWMIVVICLSSFMLTLTQVLANLNIRYKAFKKNVIVSLTESISTRASGLSFGFTGLTTYGLFYAELIGKFFNVMTQVYVLAIDQFWIKLKEFKVNNLGLLISSYRDYPLYNLPVSLINIFATQFIIWILAVLHSPESVGYFTMSIGLLNIPLLLFANSFQPIVMKKFHEESRETSVQSFVRISLRIFFISFLIYFGLYLIAPFFVSVYLGDKWIATIPFIRALCVPFGLQLLGNSIGGAFIVFNEHRSNFLIKVMFVSFIVLGLISLLVLKKDLMDMVIFYSIFVSLEEITRILYLRFKLKNVASS